MTVTVCFLPSHLLWNDFAANPSFEETGGGRGCEDAETNTGPEEAVALALDAEE
jgi:hypothetical protein